MHPHEIVETIEFLQPVSSRNIRNAIEQQIGNSPSTWLKVVRHKIARKYRIGRSGRSLAYHLQVVPSEGNRLFDEGDHYAHRSIQVRGCRWYGRTGIRLRYEPALHQYYVRQFASQLAFALGGAVVDTKYGDDWPKKILVCSRDRCWEPAMPDFDIGISCPRHGKFTKIIPVPLQKPAH